MLDQFRGDHSAVQKLVFIFSNLLMVLIALFKCHSMGLLPTSPSDWLQFIAVREVSWANNFGTSNPYRFVTKCSFARIAGLSFRPGRGGGLSASP